MSIVELPVALAIYLLFIALVCGACAGSFLNCAALRYVTGEKLSRGRSHCPDCGHILGGLDLFPLLSWLLLKGKCRYCGAKVAGRYPLTEALSALVWCTTAARFGPTWQTVEHCLLFSLLLVLALIDYDTLEIPGGLLIAGIGVFIMFLPAYEPLTRLKWGLIAGAALGGALLIISLIMDKVLGRESMGGGDIKLFALLGLFTGPGTGLFLVILSCVAGLVFAFSRKAKGKPFPVGPAIALAAWPALLLGPGIVDWYLGLFL